MFDVSDAHRFRKTIAGLCMILAPVFFLAASIVTPGFDSSERAFAELITSDRDAFGAAQALAFAGWALFIPAVLGVVHMLRERGVAEGHLGGLLALLGAVGGIAQCGAGLAMWQSGPTQQVAGLLVGLGDSVAATVLLFVLPFGVTLGTILLAWGLYRRRFAPTWMAACLGLAGIVFAIAALTYSQEIYIAASVILLAGLGALGLRVLQESVEDWEHTPELAAGAR